MILYDIIDDFKRWIRVSIWIQTFDLLFKYLSNNGPGAVGENGWDVRGWVQFPLLDKMCWFCATMVTSRDHTQDDIKNPSVSCVCGVV